MSEKPSSFLQSLFDKKAAVQSAGNMSKKDMSKALNEVDRQIRQALKGNPFTGGGVTKSGKED